MCPPAGAGLPPVVRLPGGGRGDGQLRGLPLPRRRGLLGPGLPAARALLLRVRLLQAQGEGGAVLQAAVLQ